MIIKYCLRATFILPIALIALSSFTSVASAQDGGSRYGFSITPPILELTANPGDTLTETISLFNDGEHDLTIGTTIENLKPIGLEGQVEITPEIGDSLPSLKDWISISPYNQELKTKTTENVSFAINVPADAAPGGHFASVLFGTTAKGLEAGTGTVISEKIGTLVLLTIPGETKEKAEILEFKSDQTTYLENQNINFDLKIRNGGNVYVKPKGYLTITNIFGQKVREVTVEGKNILPGATRQIPLELTSGRFFGRYTATLSLVYGSNNQNVSATTGFTVIPWKSSALALILICGLVLLRRRLWKAIKVIIGKER